MYFDINAHKSCFRTTENEAYFWHGNTNGCGGQNNALEIADEKGKTLEKCMLEHRDELEKAGVRFRDLPDETVDISYGCNQIESNKFWDDCSRSFAEQASGNIHVIAGSDPRPNGQSENDYPCTYNRVEFPTLEQNKNINSITYIDPATKETIGVVNFKHSESTGTELSTNSQTNRDVDLKTDLGISTTLQSADAVGQAVSNGMK